MTARLIGAVLALLSAWWLARALRLVLIEHRTRRDAQ